MTAPGEAVARLRTLPRADRHDALVALLVAEFKRSLLMDEDDELPFDQNYFDLGLTSLSLTELRKRLAVALGRDLDVTVMFNRPTVAHLTAYLTGTVLADLFGHGADPAPPPVPDDRRALVDELLTRLYDS